MDTGRSRIVTSFFFVRAILYRDSGYQKTFCVEQKIGGTLTDVPDLMLAENPMHD